MKKLSFAALIVATMLLSAFTIIKAIDWKISDSYSIKFVGKGAEGVFKKFTANITFDENDLKDSKFSTTIDVSSIATGNGIKNRHARKENWFDAEKYPSIVFNSNNFSKAANGYQVDGTLEMHGVKKQITIPFTFVSNIFKANFSVNRMDYGVGSMEGMSKKVADQINLEISVPVTKK